MALQQELPGNHLLFLVRGMTATPQQLGRRGQEVHTVVLKVLVYQRQQDLEAQKRDLSNDSPMDRREAPDSSKTLTFAKNLISCSCGDFSTLPLLTTASVRKEKINVQPRSMYHVTHINNV